MDSPLVFPQLILDEFLVNMLRFLREDLQTNSSNDADTVLYKLFGDTERYRQQYFKEAKDLFIRDERSSRFVDVRLIFDRDRAKIPTIHLTVPSDNEAMSGIGVNEGFKRNDIVQDGRRIQAIYTKFFEGRFSVVFTSDNEREVVIMYEVVRALMIAATNHFELSGMQNVKFTGQDLSLHPDLIPPHIYIKMLTLTCLYEVSAPAFETQALIGKIFLNINSRTCNCDDGC